MIYLSLILYLENLNLGYAGEAAIHRIVGVQDNQMSLTFEPSGNDRGISHSRVIKEGASYIIPKMSSSARTQRRFGPSPFLKTLLLVLGAQVYEKLQQ